MNAIEISAPGGPEVLRLAERPMPSAERGEVVIEVIAAGVNRPDVMQRWGKYPPPQGASDIPGLEVAGIVSQVGPEVQQFKPGDHVCALVVGGGYAEFCSAPEVQCLPVPRGLNFVEAAALPETFFTVWANVFDRAGLKSGESILIHGGSSGIGTTAIQLARAFGARVFVTAGSPEKCRACERLGAEHAANYRTENFAEMVKRWTDGRGVDVILDMIGGEYFSRNLESLAMEGRLVHIAVMRGAKVELNLVQVMQRRITITGSTLRARPASEKGAIAERLKKEVWPLLESGKVKPVLHTVFPLAAASEAHRLMEDGSHIGKIVLQVKAAT